MTVKLSLEDLHLGPTRDLCALNNDDPPFSFRKDCNLVEPAELPRTYINPKLDTGTYWGQIGPRVGQP